MFSTRLFLYFRISTRQFTKKISAQKTDIFHLSGRVYRRFFRTKRSFAQTTRVDCIIVPIYDERPVGRSRRTADASRLSAGFRAKKPSVLRALI